MYRPGSGIFLAIIIASIAWCGIATSAHAQEEWRRIIEAAKKENKVVAGGPPTAVLRKQFKETFESRFGIELELLSAPGPQNAQRAIAEFRSRGETFRRAARRLGDIAATAQ